MKEDESIIEAACRKAKAGRIGELRSRLAFIPFLKESEIKKEEIDDTLKEMKKLGFPETVIQTLLAKAKEAWEKGNNKKFPVDIDFEL